MIWHGEGIKNEDKYDALLRIEELMANFTRNLLKLSNVKSFSMQDNVTKYTGIMDAVEKVFAVENNDFHLGVSYWKGKDFPFELAKSMALIGMLKDASDVLNLHEEEHLSVIVALRVGKVINEALSFDILTRKLSTLEPVNEWESSLQEMMVQSIEHYKYGLCKILAVNLAETELKNITAEGVLSFLSKSNEVGIQGYISTIESIRSTAAVNLVSISVAVNRLNFLGTIGNRG